MYFISTIILICEYFEFRNARKLPRIAVSTHLLCASQQIVLKNLLLLLPTCYSF